MIEERRHLAEPRSVSVDSRVVRVAGWQGRREGHRAIETKLPVGYIYFALVSLGCLFLSERVFLCETRMAVDPSIEYRSELNSIILPSSARLGSNP